MRVTSFGLELPRLVLMFSWVHASDTPIAKPTKTHSRKY